MKTNKKNQLIVCLLGALFFALAGCSGILNSPEGAETFTQNGTGNVVVAINGGGSGRTLMPPMGDGGAFSHYELSFSNGPGGASHGTETITAGTTATVSLEAGTWTITAQAKSGSTVKAQGSWTGAVSESAVTQVSIPLTPSAGSNGDFNYTITFPNLGDGSSAKSLALYSVAADGTETEIAGSPKTDFTSGQAAFWTGLAPGFYRLNLTLTNSLVQTAGKTEALHIYPGSSTYAEWEFTDADFTEPTGSTVKLITTEAELANIGVDTANWPLDGNYMLGNDLTLDNWTPIGNVTWQDASTPVSDTSTPFTGSFDGGGYTITLNSFNSSVTGNHYLGIFSVVTGISESAKARVKNLNIVSGITTPVSLTNNNGAALGLVAGYTQFAEISNITFSGTLEAIAVKNAYIGGIVGYIQKGSLIKDSSSSMNINISGGTGSGLASGMYYSLAGGFVGLFKDGGDTTNCHATGNITYISSVSGSQAFVGGIAGGSYYQFTTESQGSISYCSNTGDVYCDVQGFWAWTGGITGVVCGDGDSSFEKTTKVYRSWASGNVKAVVHNQNQWAYTGGITGYIYYGGMVAECYFTGNVSSGASPEGAPINDYVGGISGYLSQNPIHKSTIRDCWSSGTVGGRLNAGGIVGQHQFYTTLSNCWSRAEISVSGLRGQIESAAQQGAGGIAGYSITGVSSNDARLENCVALNPFISAPNGFERVGRVVGDCNGGEAYDSYGWSDMPVLVSGSPAEPFVLKDPSGNPTRWSIDGTDCAAKPGIELYRDTLSWDFVNIWKMGSDGYPHLKWE